MRGLNQQFQINILVMLTDARRGMSITNIGLAKLVTHSTKRHILSQLQQLAHLFGQQNGNSAPLAGKPIGSRNRIFSIV